MSNFDIRDSVFEMYLDIWVFPSGLPRSLEIDFVASSAALERTASGAFHGA
jgi:hypothetical protein